MSSAFSNDIANSLCTSDFWFNFCQHAVRRSIWEFHAIVYFVDLYLHIEEQWVFLVLKAMHFYNTISDTYKYTCNSILFGFELYAILRSLMPQVSIFHTVFCKKKTSDHFIEKSNRIYRKSHASPASRSFKRNVTFYGTIGISSFREIKVTILTYLIW